MNSYRSRRISHDGTSTNIGCAGEYPNDDVAIVALHIASVSDYSNYAKLVIEKEKEKGVFEIIASTTMMAFVG